MVQTSTHQRTEDLGRYLYQLKWGSRRGVSRRGSECPPGPARAEEGASETACAGRRNWVGETSSAKDMGAGKGSGPDHRWWHATAGDEQDEDQSSEKDRQKGKGR